MTKVIVIVQARMGSSRLPGKMLRLLAGQVLTDHVLARLSSLLQPDDRIAHLVVATSTSAQDNALVSHIQQKWASVDVVRGAEDDVLDRFITVLNTFPATTVVRVTGDCPLLNLENIGTLLDAHEESDADVTNYQPGFEYVDKGLEVVSADALRKAAQDPELTPRDREHVTALLYRRPERYRVRYVDSDPYLQRGDIRLTIDTEADLKFWEALCKSLGKEPASMELNEVVQHLDQHPELLAINADAGRKSTLHERARIGFRCDGGVELGLGHVIGCLRMARLLAKEFEIGIEFVVRDHRATIELIKKSGFAVEVLPSETSPEHDIKRIVKKAAETDWSAVIVNFCKDALDRYASVFSHIKDAGIPLIFMDNPVPSSYLIGDLVVNALPHPSYPGYCPSQHRACHDGLEFFLLDEAFEQYRNKERELHPKVQRVLVAMGGGDGNNATGFVLEALQTAHYSGYIDVVLGAANPHKNAIHEQFERSELNGEVHCNVNDMPARMWAADIGFSALGLTSYEMGFLGLPALLIPGSEFNTEVARHYCEQSQTALLIGQHKNVSRAELARAFLALCDDVDRRAFLSTQGRVAIGSKVSSVLLPALQRFIEN